jgi:hypothetical protein
VFTRQQLTGMPEQQAALAAGAAAPDDQQPTAAEGGSVAAGAPLLPPAPAAAPVSAEVAVSQARQAVGFTLLLPPNATLHGALQAARQCSQSMHSRSLIQVCLSRGGMFQPQPICSALTTPESAAPCDTPACALTCSPASPPLPARPPVRVRACRCPAGR